VNRIRRGPQRADRFTIIPNSWARDVTLTWGARGLLTWLHSHTAEFEVTEAKIIEASRGAQCGRDGVRKLIRELEGHGYLKRERRALITGGVTVDYVLQDPTEIPSEAPLAADGISVNCSDQGKEASEVPETAGQAPDRASDGISVARSLQEDQEKTKKTSSSSRAPRSATATRVPDDFVPDEKMRAWYAAEKLEQCIDGRIEHQKFMNYWQALPGVKGKKLDWPATWRNWMLEAASRADRFGARRPVSGPPSMPGSSLVPHSAASRLGISATSSTNNKVLQGLALAEKFRKMEENQ
jgi:hypothetical protein